MTKKPRRTHSPEFKALVAIAALAPHVSIATVAREYGIHANLVTRWRKTLLERASSLFEKPSGDPQSARIEAERDFLSRALGLERGPSGAR